MVGYFEIKKHLKGKNPKKVERKANGVHIENCDGQTIVANNGSENIVNNMHIDQLVTNVVVYAQSNDSSHGFTVSDKVHSVTCTPDDIQHMSKPLPIQEKFTSICSRANVTLAIKKPDLLGYSMWSFKLNGRTIEASMGDKYWLEKVHNGDIVIRAHDCISTSLETVIETDESGVPIENSTRYTVMQVYELFSSYGENTQSKL